MIWQTLQSPLEALACGHSHNVRAVHHSPTGGAVPLPRRDGDLGGKSTPPRSTTEHTFLGKVASPNGVCKGTLAVWGRPQRCRPRDKIIGGP